MTIYNVNNSSPTCLVTNAVQNDTWITNISPYTLYMSNDANVNTTNYDYILTAGSSVQWSAGEFAYAIFSAPFSGAIEITSNALNLNNQNSITSGSSTGYDVLYNGPVPLGGSTYYTYFNVSPYQSIRIRYYPINTGTPSTDTYPIPGPLINTTNYNSIINIGWTDVGPAPDQYSLFTSFGNYASSYVELENYYITSSQQTYTNSQYCYGYSLVTDVKAPFLLPFLAPPDYPLAGSRNYSNWKMEITGYILRQPKLFYEKVAFSNSSVGNVWSTAQVDTFGPLYNSSILAGSPGSTVAVAASPLLQLPCWSGKIHIQVRAVTNVAATLLPWANIFTANISNSSGDGVVLPLNAIPSSTRDYRGDVTLQGYHTPLVIQMVTGTGYATLEPYALVTFYGNEES